MTGIEKYGFCPLNDRRGTLTAGLVTVSEVNGASLERLTVTERNTHDAVIRARHSARRIKLIFETLGLCSAVRNTVGPDDVPVFHRGHHMRRHIH